MTIARLLSIASDPIGALLSSSDCAALDLPWLCEVLKLRNGFYAFESALMMRPYSQKCFPMGIVEWNDPKGWKANYDIDLSSECFFAEDIFGEQFSARNDGIAKFDPETGESKLIAANLDEWASKIIDDYPQTTGQPLAHSWQAIHGPLRAGQRLVPKLPFVLGGEFSLTNLAAMNESEMMEVRSKIANQIAGLTEGAKIEFQIVE